LSVIKFTDILFLGILILHVKIMIYDTITIIVKIIPE